MSRCEHTGNMTGPRIRASMLQRIVPLLNLKSFYYTSEEQAAIKARLESEIEAIKLKALHRVPQEIQRKHATVQGARTRGTHAGNGIASYKKSKLDGFSKITRNDLIPYLQVRCAVTYLDGTDLPRRYEGVLTDLSRSRVRLEKFSGRTLKPSFDRIVRFEVLKGRRAIVTLWYNGTVERARNLE